MAEVSNHCTGEIGFTFEGSVGAEIPSPFVTDILEKCALVPSFNFMVGL